MSDCDRSPGGPSAAQWKACSTAVEGCGSPQGAEGAGNVSAPFTDLWFLHSPRVFHIRAGMEFALCSIIPQRCLKMKHWSSNSYTVLKL